MSLELEMNLRLQKTQKSNKRSMAPKALQQPFDLARVWFEGGGGRGVVFQGQRHGVCPRSFGTSLTYIWSSKDQTQQLCDENSLSLLVIWGSNYITIWHVMWTLVCVRVLTYQCWVGIRFFDIYWIQFSQNRLQKGFDSHFLIKKTYIKSGYQDFYSKKLTSSHDAGSHKFENNPLSFDSSHQPIIIILKVKNQNYKQITNCFENKKIIVIHKACRTLHLNPEFGHTWGEFFFKKPCKTNTLLNGLEGGGKGEEGNTGLNLVYHKNRWFCQVKQPSTQPPPPPPPFCCYIYFRCS